MNAAVASSDSSFSDCPKRTTKVHKVPLTTIPKKYFVIAYGKAHGYISFQTFIDVCALNTDECHRTSDIALVYSCLHFKERVNTSVLEDAMRRLNLTHGVGHCTVFEYDGVGFSSKSNNIEDHFAFKMLVEHMYQTIQRLFLALMGFLLSGKAF